MSSYLVESANTGQHHTIPEPLHVVPMPLQNDRVLRAIIGAIIIRFQFQRPLRQVFQFHNRFRFGSSMRDSGGRGRPRNA